MIRGYHEEASSVLELEINVTDITLYLFCPYKLYLIRHIGLKGKPTRESTLGKVAHKAYLITSILLSKGANLDSVRKEIVKRVTTELNINSVSIEDLEKAIDEAIDARMRIPISGTPVVTEARLKSAKLKLIGVIDLLEGNTLVEVKYRETILKRDIIQLALYALLLEDCCRLDVDYGYIDLLKSKRRVKIEITDEIRRRALKLRDQVQITIIAGLYPRHRESCDKCDLLVECKSLFL